MGPVAPLLGKLVAVDTSPFIYFIEEHPDYIAYVDPLFEAVDRGDIRLITSALTLTEVLILPLRFNDPVLVEKYKSILLMADNIATVDVSNEIATEAAQLRATYKFKTPDAIHLATAKVERADAFLTNDTAFVKVTDLDIILVHDLGRAN